MKKWWPYVAVAVAAVLLAVFESDVLYTAQEQSLFLHTPLFFEQQMVKAGGLLTWAGCYLTQFFYYPLLGAGLLGMLWLLLMKLLQLVFRQKEVWTGVVPIACLLMTITTLGYWVYYLKLPGALFVATLGTLMAVLMVWCYRLLPAKCLLRTAFIPVSACIGYPLFGFYGLWATALMGLMSWKLKDGYRLADSLLALLSIIAIPLITYHTVYHETNIVNIYWTALPVFSFQGAHFFGYYVPYILLVVSVSLMLLPIPQVKWLRTFVLTIIVLCVALFWYKDDNFHRELSMSRSMDHQAWEKLLQTARGAKGEPTRAMCMMQNLALFRTEQFGDKMFLYPNGAARPNAPFTVHTVHTIGKMLYLQYGLPNYCYRWCMEDGVEYGWTAERLKLMALCSLVNGEFPAARRFLNMLKKTDFHRNWARRYEAYIRQPRHMTSDPALRPVFPLLRNDDFLTADQSQQELFLIEHILSTPGASFQQQELARLTMQYYRKNRHKLVEQ